MALKVNLLDSYFLDNFYKNIISDQILKVFNFDSFKTVIVKTLIKTVYLSQGL